MLRHAYLIMAHADMPLLKVLIGMLDDERNDIYIHADRKWRDFDPRSLSTQRAGLYVLPDYDRISVYWGHISIMNVEYLLFERAYSHGGYARYHLLSGMDLPIKSQDYIHQFFADHHQDEFVSYWLEPSALADAYYKVSRYSFGLRYEKMPRNLRYISIVWAKMRLMIGDLLYRIVGARAESDKFLKGANWVSLTGTAIGHILGAQEQTKRRLRFTRNSDEIFVQTILVPYFESQGVELASLCDMREVIWLPGSPSPETLTMEHRDRLVSSPNLFARKFSTAVDSSIIELVRTTYSNQS